ncbi:MAG: NAD-dependent epimerase/dehydratase family protein [Oscillochloridaceae bacterium]|nr:NAD-dependent epimerase/dehydratase family protein [Chloroflexaceae bacterium]MDW8389762.1 NAD-dependent epimerase/dehydratase family protein [Oscillochloridaceae bacterium]
MAYYLIAGASGYVGSRLAERLLSAGHRVRGLVLNPDTPVVEQLASQGMSVWIGDLTRPETLVGIAEGAEYVFNLTSCSVLESSALHRTYVSGNLNLINACERTGPIAAYVFTSNVTPYGDAGDSWVNEDFPVAPQHLLGEVMAEAERNIMRVARERRFPAIILRVASIYGPERDPVTAMETGLTTIYGDGRNFVPHIHVDDLLDVLERIPLNGQPGAIYNVGDDEPLRQIELASEIRRRLGMVPPRTFSPAAALRAGLDPSIIGSLTASVRLDNRRLRHDLGLNLRYPSLRTWLDERLPVETAVAVDA